MTQRYYTQSGCNPEIRAAITLAGPQMANHVPEEVVKMLDRPGIKQVAVIFDHGLGKRIELFQKIEESPPTTADAD
jgi:hypothetical protein